MQVVHKMKKTPFIKTFRDFSDQFNAEINTLSSASLILVAFDTYFDTFLKDSVRTHRVGKTTLPSMQCMTHLISKNCH